MALYISEVLPPAKPLALVDCRIPCTIKNDTGSDVEVKVALFDDDDDHLWDQQPTIHWHNMDAGEEYAFDGSWDTLHFVLPTLRTWNMRIELHEETLGKVETHYFTLVPLTRPDWWGSLMDMVASNNTETITEPLLGLFTGFDIEGFTLPPYTCFLCGAEFTGETADDDFANHLISHIQAFIGGWFE